MPHLEGAAVLRALGTELARSAALRPADARRIDRVRIAWSPGWWASRTPATNSLRRCSEGLLGIEAPAQARQRSALRHAPSPSRGRPSHAPVAHLDRYAAWNVNFVPVAPDPHSGPRRAKRAKETLATSRGLRRDIKGGTRDWIEHRPSKARGPYSVSRNRQKNACF